ncbi:MAG: Copper-exporting P-type ATPase A [Chlamydiae bacterium]|nr:Copper-exporting P-type ATPase A [Chlamydiota bacterium]
MEKKRCELAIGGMTCVSCANGIQKSLNKNPGVLEANVNFATNRAVIVYDPSKVDPKNLVASVHEVGYEAEVIGKHAFHMHNRNERASFKKFIVAALLTLPLMLEMIGVLLGFPERIPVWIQLILATIVQFWCGWSFYTSSFYSLKARSANMDVLIAMGTTAAYGFSLVVVIFGLDQPLYFESSAMIITLVLLGRWLETRSKRKASSAIEKLLKLQPKIVRVKRNGTFVDLPVEKIQRGDLFLVRPGENIAVDGVVREGESAVDEATLTGESFPVSKEPEAKVFAGTTNTNGSLTVEATQIGADTVLSRMVKLVEHAQNSRAPIQKLADKISEIFVPAVVVISALTLLVWLFFGSPLSTALINAVAVLVIACPCALGLATPTVIMVASGRAAEVGVLFKEARALEVIQNMDVLIVDKTGTLTQGHPHVQEVFPEQGFDQKEILQIAASLSHLSSHPLSDAIVSLAKKWELPIEPVHEFQSLSGKGITGNKRGQKCTLGSVQLAREQGVKVDINRVQAWQEDGKTVSIVWVDQTVQGYILIEDEIRETTPKAIRLLHEREIPIVMITGDSQNTAESVAARLGIDHFYASVLPEEKAQKVQELKNKNLIVGMVGDGVNDAPALATAHVGFAIDYGSDVAIEASDITLLNGDLMGVVKAIDLSKMTYRKIRQNLFFAFFYNILGIPLAALGLLNPIIAAAAMAMSSLSVVGNALLLKKWKPVK